MEVFKGIIEKDGLTLNIKVTQTKNKQTYFQIREDHLLIRIGKYHTYSDIKEYVLKKFKTFHKKVNTRILLQRKEGIITLLGIDYEMMFAPQKEKYIIGNNTIYISDKYKSNPLKVQKEIEKAELEKEISLFNKKNKEKILFSSIPILPIRIKDIRRSFGYFRKKTQDITLSNYCIMMPRNLIWHIIFHEYSHFKNFDHSRSFYDFFEKLDDNYTKNAKELKKYAIL